MHQFVHSFTWASNFSGSGRIDMGFVQIGNSEYLRTQHQPWSAFGRSSGQLLENKEFMGDQLGIKWLHQNRKGQHLRSLLNRFLPSLVIFNLFFHRFEFIFLYFIDYLFASRFIWSFPQYYFKWMLGNQIINWQMPCQLRPFWSGVDLWLDDEIDEYEADELSWSISSESSSFMNTLFFSFLSFNSVSSGFDWSQESMIEFGYGGIW